MSKSGKGLEVSRVVMRIAWLAFALLMEAGCGGGGSSVNDGQVSTQTLHSQGSDLTVSYSGKPLVAAFGVSASITAMSGAAFTSLSLVPARILSNTFIVFDRAHDVWVSDSLG